MSLILLQCWFEIKNKDKTKEKILRTFSSRIQWILTVFDKISVSMSSYKSFQAKNSYSYQTSKLAFNSRYDVKCFNQGSVWEGDPPKGGVTFSKSDTILAFLKKLALFSSGKWSLFSENCICEWRSRKIFASGEVLFCTASLILYHNYW